MNELRELKLTYNLRTGEMGLSGGDADDIALIAGQIVGGMNAAGPAPAPVQPRIPEKPAPNAQEDGAFVDESVNLYHPAILALEQYIHRNPGPFDLLWLRRFVGEQITGTPRECRTRAVGTLMTRLEKAGVVTKTGTGRWEKLAKVRAVS